MIYKYEKHATFVKDGKPQAFVRFDEETRQRVIYKCEEAGDTDLEDLFSHFEQNLPEITPDKQF